MPLAAYPDPAPTRYAARMTGACPFVLLVGLAPDAVDFSKFPGLDAAKLTAGLQAALAEVRAAGFDAEWCLTGSAPESAEAMVAASLAARRPDAVMIGAGVRTDPAHFLLFERLVNLVHAAAPAAKLCFNTSPDSTLAAIRRWL
jgi:hypothetical protein